MTARIYRAIERTIEMTSFGTDTLVKDRIRERLLEADHERLARLVGASTHEASRRPPRGPLFIRITRMAAHFTHA
jgi:hypothetical protein